MNKTPREILLERHRAAEPKLDDLRERIVLEHFATCASPQSAIRNPQSAIITVLWRELIWPVRRIWLGFAVIWIVIVVMNFETSEEPKFAKNEARETPTPELQAALDQQRQLLAELMDSAPEEPADKPRSPLQPRSEHGRQWATA